MNYPKLRVVVPDGGRTILATVTLDGKQLPATRVQFDTGASLDGLVKVHVEFYADIELEVQGTASVTGIEAVVA